MWTVSSSANHPFSQQSHHHSQSEDQSEKENHNVLPHLNSKNPPLQTSSLLQNNTTRVFGKVILNNQNNNPNFTFHHHSQSLQNNKNISCQPPSLKEKKSSPDIANIDSSTIDASKSHDLLSNIKECSTATFNFPSKKTLLQIQVENSKLLDDYNMRTINHFDIQFLQDPSQVANFVQPIFIYLLKHQVKNISYSQIYSLHLHLQEKFICGNKIELSNMHANVNETMRCLLINWLTEVSMKYMMKEESLFLAVQLMDIYCRLLYQEGIYILRENFQKVGVTCLFIAAKIEEIYPAPANEFVTICDGAYILNDILQQEVDICLRLQFDFSFPTPYTFFLRYSKVLRHTSKQSHQVNSSYYLFYLIHSFTKGLFILYVSQMHYELSPIYVKPSVLACCSCFFVENLSQEDWDVKVESLSDIVNFHSYKEFSHLLKHVQKMIKFLNKPEFPFDAIRKKFTSDSLGNITSLITNNEQQPNLII